MNSTDGRFSASKNHIIVFPDTTRKLIDAMKDIEQEGFNLAEEIPKGKYYPELNLVVVTNHRHHVAAAQATNSILKSISTVRLFRCPQRPLYTAP